MRIEINAGGLGAGLAVAEYQWNMSGFISDAEDVISCFKTVAAEVCDLNGGVGNLQSALDEISGRIREEEEKKLSAEAVQKQSGDFLELAIRVDKQVASLVNQNKEEFYATNPWLRPAVDADGIEWYGNVWDWLDETARKAWDGATAVYDYLLDNYDNHGWVYYLWEGGKIGLKGAKAIIKIGGAIVSLLTVPGASIPIAILEIISALNDLYNATVDTHYLGSGQFDKVGKTDLLKEVLISNAGELGSLLGNESLGEKAGELIYYGIDLVSFLDGVDELMKAFGKLNVDMYGYHLPGSFVWGEVNFDDVFDNEYDIFFDTKFENFPKFKLEHFLKSTLLGINPASTLGLISDILDGIYKSYDDGSKLMENMVQVLV